MSPKSQEPVTRASARTYVVLTAFLAFAAAYVLAVGQQASNVDDLRAVCDSANRQRTSELFQRESLILNAKARAADQTTHAEGRAALARARESKRRLIHSTTGTEPGSVVRDCDGAYRKPFPFSLFDG